MKTIVIPVNRKIASNFEGYKLFIDTYNKLHKTNNSSIIFDFAKNTWLEANLCAILGVLVELLKENNNKIEFINLSDTLEELLTRNGFLLTIKEILYIPLNFNETTLSYKKFSPNDDAVFMDYIKSELLKKPDFPKHSVKLGKKITESIFEIYENARTHGKCLAIHVCGQYFPNKINKVMHVTIVDRGNTIRKNVRNFLKNPNYTGSDAIDWAMKKNNTTKIDTPGGLGLDIILEFVKLNDGKIQVVSSDGYWEYKEKNGVIKRDFRHPFIGTIVNISFNLNDKNIYYLEEENIEDVILNIF